MAANIVKSMHCALLIAHHDKALTRHLLNKVIARPGELALVPHANPVPGKDLRLFLRENFRRNKVTLRQRPCARGKAFGRLAEDRRFRWSRRLHPACSHVASARVNGDVTCRELSRDTWRALPYGVSLSDAHKFSPILLQHRLVKPIPVVEIVQVHRVLWRQASSAIPHAPRILWRVSSSWI